MANPPIAPRQLELLHTSMLVNATMRKEQMPVLPNNLSTPINPATGRLIQDSGVPPKGDLFAGQHNPFASNILLGPEHTVSSFYIKKQERITQVNSLLSSSVPDTSPRTWSCLARGMGDEHKRVSIYLSSSIFAFDSMLLHIEGRLSHFPTLFQNNNNNCRWPTLSSRTISNMVTNSSALTLLAKARGSSSAFVPSAIYQLPSHAFVVATTTANLRLPPRRMRRLAIWRISYSKKKMPHRVLFLVFRIPRTTLLRLLLTRFPHRKENASMPKNLLGRKPGTASLGRRFGLDWNLESSSSGSRSSFVTSLNL
jgi:hypothetical protein